MLDLIALHNSFKNVLVLDMPPLAADMCAKVAVDAIDQIVSSFQAPRKKIKAKEEQSPAQAQVKPRARRARAADGDIQSKVLNYLSLSSSEPVSVSQIADFIKEDQPRVARTLRELVDLGNVKKVGERRGTRYILAGQQEHPGNGKGHAVLLAGESEEVEADLT